MNSGICCRGKELVTHTERERFKPACDCIDFLCSFTFCHLIKLELHEFEEYKAFAVVCIPCLCKYSLLVIIHVFILSLWAKYKFQPLSRIGRWEQSQKQKVKDKGTTVLFSHITFIQHMKIK